MRTVRAFTITRAGNLDPNVRVVEQRAQSFSTSQAAKQGASLIVSRDASGLRSHVVTPDISGADKQVLSLAQAVAGRLEPADELPDLTSAPSVGHLVYRPTDASVHSNQAGIDLAEMSRQLANVMPDDSWAGLSVRAARKGEVKRWSRWLCFRMNTPRPQHHSMNPHAAVVSVWAGGADRHQVEMILDTVRANLPGFDIDTHTEYTSRSMARAVPALFGVAVAAATILGYLPIANLYGIGAAVAGVLASAAVHLGFIPTADSKVRAALARGYLPVPAGRAMPPAAPRKATTRKDSDGNVVNVPEKEGAYPLAASTFKMGPALLAAMIAPHAGATSGVQTTAIRATPPTVTERIGPLLGAGDDGQPVHLSAVNIDSTVALVGAAGSGKALSLETRVPVPVSEHYPSGWATVGTLREGDLVFDRDGNPTEVIGFSETFDGDCYRVEFSDGQQVVADADHLWVAGDMNRRIGPGSDARRSHSAQHRSNETARLVSVSRQLAPGTFLALSDISEITGIGSDSLRDFSKTSGIAWERVLVRKGTRKAAAYPAAELIRAYADHLSTRAWRTGKPVHQVITTREMSERATRGAQGRPRWKVPMSAPVEGNLTSLPVHPYVLGAWLGDGTTTSPSITSADREVIDSVETFGHRFTRMDSKEGSTASTYYFPSLMGPLRDLGFTLDGRRDTQTRKHIPAAYMRAAFEQRIALIQGIMDTDGHISEQGSCELSMADRGLVEQTRDVLRSLGIKVGPVRTEASHYTINGVRHPGSGKHRITFTTDLKVFRLRRKTERLPQRGSLRPTQRYNYIASIAPTDSVPVRCVSVASPTATFLVEGFIPTHNSSAVRHLAAWYMLERTRPCGDPTFPGRNNSMVVFIPKADDAAKVGAWARTLGDQMRRVEVANPDGIAIDLFGVPGTIKDKALHVVSAMRYAFGAESIGVESQRSLTWVLTAAQVVDDEVAATAGLPTGMSPMFYAYILLAGSGDEKAVGLSKAIESCLSVAQTRAAKAERDGNLDALSVLQDRVANLTLARDELQVMFGPKVTTSQRAAFQKAPGNKVYGLLNLEHWWSPRRRRFSWDQAITGHRSVLVMTGTTDAGHRMELETERAIASMLMFSLRDTIERNCSGWAEQDRWVTIVADELSDLAGASPEVLSWARDRGRSYGVRLVFATQRPGQLPPEIKTAFMSFSTLVAFKQDTGPVAAEIAADLAADGSDWSAADVLNLPEHHAIVRANVSFSRQPPFVCKPGFWEHDMGSFAAAQGYDTYPTNGA